MFLVPSSSAPVGCTRRVGSPRHLPFLNGDADDGNQGASDDGSVVDLRFWVRPAGSNLTVVYYNSQGFPTFDDSIPPNHGFHFFAGGPANASSSKTRRSTWRGTMPRGFRPSTPAGRPSISRGGSVGTSSRTTRAR
jgi:hypothetical protein